MQPILGEFLKQTITVIVFVTIIIAAVKLGIYFRERKNLKEESQETK